MNSLKIISLFIISFFIVNISTAQNEGQKQQVVNAKSPTKDTVLSRTPQLWITRLIQSMNLSSWSLSASVGPSLYAGSIKQYDWFPMSHKYIEDKLIPEEDAKVPANYRIGSAANPDVSERKWAGVFSINKQFGSMLGIQGEYMFGTLSGVSYKTYTSSQLDANGNPINLPYHNDYFIAQFHEWDLNAILNFNKWLFPYRPSGKFGIYAFGGIGLIIFKSSLRDLKTDKSENDAAALSKPPIKSDLDLKYIVPQGWTTETSFPVGIGVKYHITPRWNIFLEYSQRWVNTRKLDSWDNSLADKDSHQVLNLGLNFTLGKFSDSLLESRLKPIYKLQKVPHIAKERQDARIDSLQKVMGDLGHRVSMLEENNRISADSLKALANKLVQTVPQTGLNTMTFSPTDAVTQLLVVFFDFDKYNIPEKYHGNVALVARILKSDPNITMQIVGHADEVGSEEYNMELSKKRADAVAFELKDAYEIAPSRLTDIISKGKSDPLSNKYSDVNRRVDFIFTKPIEGIKNDVEKANEKGENLKVDSEKVKVNNGQVTDNKKLQGMFFKVQFATSPVKKDIKSSEFNGLENVDFYFENGLYKYTSGNEKELSGAKKILRKLKKKGFKDAFIVTFSDGKRIK